MGTGPTIQDLSPAYVVKVLMKEPSGTYIIRSSVPNDDTISSVKMNNQSSSSPARDRYVVLSVRVSDRKNPSPIMNYRLTFTGEDSRQLLKQYYSKKTKLEKLSQLKRELIVSSSNPNWIIDCKQFINIKSGQYGGEHHAGTEVATWKRSRQDHTAVFIKKFSKKSEFYTNELKIFKELCFFSIIPLYGHYSDQKYNYLVFPYAGRSLKSISPIQGDAHETSTQRICKIAFQIANAMIYLDKKNIVHRDLTASNVLLDDQGFIRIVDFGHAIQKEEGQNNLKKIDLPKGQKACQLRYIAPECIQGSGSSSTNSPSEHNSASFSSKSDVWAFGILLIELMIDKHLKPYPDIKDDYDVLRTVCNRKMHPQPDGCNIDLYLVLQECWAFKPIDRISFTEIRQKMHIEPLGLLSSKECEH